MMTQKPKEIVCANCGKSAAVSAVSNDVLPFCSKRCKMIDLGKWLGEKYVIASDHIADIKKSDTETE